MEVKNRFGVFIAKLRKEKGISLEQLCDGLCTPGMLSRFERGEREPEKLLQNRFLTRLGTVPENYENFLYYKEYCRWEKRQGILHYILEENMEEAKRLLEEYYQTYDMKEALEKQFYLAMLAQIRRYEGCGREELAPLFEEALQLTVPDINIRSFRKRVLSLEELNLLLEYRYCQNNGISLQFYETLLEYIEKMGWTTLALAKIYPKTVYYYYMVWKQKDSENEVLAERMIQLCDKGIEILRNANRMFFLWELFCMREELSARIPECVRSEAGFVQRRKDCIEWKETLEELYLEYGISIAMYEFCYLYVESENYCIGDVIRIRRKMLGLSQEKLCKGICDSRTVSRLERHIRRPQKEIVQQLFERLNLSTELCRTELVTDSQEAIEKLRELKVRINNHEYDRARELISQLKTLISIDNPTNAQIIERNELLIDITSKKLYGDECVLKMKRVLEYTVPYSKTIAKELKYLTNEEIACLENITLGISWENKEMKECVDAIEAVCNTPKNLCNYVRIYEFTMIAISSHLGNKGMFERSNEIKKKVLRLSLQNRRTKALHYILYGLLWNKENQKMNLQSYNGIVNTRKELEKCVYLSRLCRDRYRENAYNEKIKGVLE